MGGTWTMDNLKHGDHPPIPVVERPCVDCGTVLRFKRYWDSNGSRYTRPMAYCKGCKGNVHLSRDGVQKTSVQLTTCPECGGPKTSRARKCTKCQERPGMKPWVPPVESVCQNRDCGEVFTHPRHQKNRKYCSARCQNLENKARRRDNYKAGIKHERKQFKRSASLALAYRHGYCCHLCGRLIDVSLGPDDGMSLTIDHIVALANGGTDNLDNLAPAHRSCNSKKGAT